MAHDVVREHGDGRFFRRDAGEDVHAVDAQHAHHVKGQVPLAHGLVDEVDVARALREFVHGNLEIGKVFRADLRGDVGLEIRLRRARINEHAEALDQQLHRAEQADGPGPEHHGIAPVAAAFAVAAVMLPARHALLHLPGLRQPFFRDGQRLGHHRHIAQIPRHRREVALLLDETFGHKTMHLVDAALGEFPSAAKVLTPLAARHAAGVGAGAAHARHHEVAGLEVLHRRADFGDFAEALVAEDQVVAARRPLAVGKGANLPVRAADAHLDGADFQLVRRGQRGLGVCEQTQLPLGGNHADGLHGFGRHQWCGKNSRPQKKRRRSGDGRRWRILRARAV